MSTTNSASSPSGDVIVLPVGADRWVAYNVFARTALGLDSRGVSILGGGADGGGECRVWKVGWFANAEGTLADPTRFRRPVESWGEGEVMDATKVQTLFRELNLVVEDQAAYRARFARKASPLDGKHFGNFHDQVGAHLFLARRSASEWWLDQKFNAERTAVRADNLYGSVQWSNLERYFKRRLRAGMRVLDLGCGTGIYAKLMADQGAEVLAVDPAENYLEIGRKNFASERLSFIQAEVGRPGALDAIPAASMDMVFMSDALLFYFVRVSQRDTQELSVLLGDIRRVLKPDGVFVSVEPHPHFYLSPWFGDEDRPFTVLTESRNRIFSTTPNFGQALQALISEGFLLGGMEEFYADPNVEVDARATAFASEFPLWTLFELVKASARP